MCRYPEGNEDDGEGQLSFEAGERLKILEPIDEDHFYWAERSDYSTTPAFFVLVDFHASFFRCFTTSALFY